MDGCLASVFFSLLPFSHSKNVVDNSRKSTPAAVNDVCVLHHRKHFYGQIMPSAMTTSLTNALNLPVKCFKLLAVSLNR